MTSFSSQYSYIAFLTTVSYVLLLSRAAQVLTPFPTAISDKTTTVQNGHTDPVSSEDHVSIKTLSNDPFSDDDDEALPTSETDSSEEFNGTGIGRFLGSPCEISCNPDLPHVFCDKITGHCECDKRYPVRLGPEKGCAKPVRLGDQCYYRQTCSFTDQHASCIQINHNAICQCLPGYHTVALQRPTKRVFCSEDLVLLTADLPTLFGVISGITIFSALMCFVLKLFSRARYSRPRHYANANIGPPILFSSDTGQWLQGIPMSVHGGRPSSRASSQRSIGSGYSRRASSGGSRGALVPSSRAESRRGSSSSIQSNASSTKSYSQKRFEQELKQKEARAAQLESLRVMSQNTNGSLGNITNVNLTPSPRTPISTDELLPSVDELREENHITSDSFPGFTRGISSIRSISYQGHIGPCSSSTELNR